ncbi:MAG TPA: hypothetical protein VIJ51_15585 [Solirubrobacteraceae bacterium]
MTLTLYTRAGAGILEDRPRPRATGRAYGSPRGGRCVESAQG